MTTVACGNNIVSGDLVVFREWTGEFGVVRFLRETKLGTCVIDHGSNVSTMVDKCALIKVPETPETTLWLLSRLKNSDIHRDFFGHKLSIGDRVYFNNTGMRIVSDVVAHGVIVNTGTRGLEISFVVPGHDLIKIGHDNG